MHSFRQSIRQWLQEFLRVHGYAGIQELETMDEPLPEVFYIGICHQGPTIHLLVNHRNIGGKRLLTLLKYGVGGPSAIVPKLPSGVNLIKRLWCVTHFCAAICRYILFRSPRHTDSNMCKLWRESFRVDQMVYALHKISDALGIPTLTCWTPVVFDDVSNVVQTDVGIILFEYISGMTSTDLNFRIHHTRSMCLGSRYLGRWSSTAAATVTDVLKTLLHREPLSPRRGPI